MDVSLVVDHLEYIGNETARTLRGAGEMCHGFMFGVGVGDGGLLALTERAFWHRVGLLEPEPFGEDTAWTVDLTFVGLEGLR